MRFVNLTPHEIVLLQGDRRLAIPPSGIVARCEEFRVPWSNGAKIDGWPVEVIQYGEVRNLPPPEAGVIYIVSGYVSRRTKRPDVFAPDTGETAVREDGRLVAVRGFVCGG